MPFGIRTIHRALFAMLKKADQNNYCFFVSDSKGNVICDIALVVHKV